jgi:hypothetical protein
VQRAVRLPLTLPSLPLGDIARLRAQTFWWKHNLGDGTWLVAREHREIPDLGAYPEIVAAAELVPGVRKQLWVSVLKAGGRIREHGDSSRADAVRVHVPIIGGGSFQIEGIDYAMRVGEFWAVDTVRRMHAAQNTGPIDRVHLLVDVHPDAWLRRHVPWL